MEKHTRVSVIIPVFNAEKYLSKCIDSVLSQTCPELELILVNDGSTDQSEEIINTYIHDDRVLYLKQENKGVSAARNLGLSHASGEYIIFVDSDDYLVPDSLDMRIEKAKTTDLLISNFYKVKDAGVKEKEKYIKEEKNISVVEALRTISPKSTIGYQGYLWNKVFRREIIKKNGILFDSSVAYGEDRLFIGQYITYCNNISLDTEAIYCYRLNDESAMASFYTITQKNYEKVKTEIIGLEAIEKLVKDYDEGIYRSFIYYEFFNCVMFYRNSDDSIPEFKKYCRKRVWKRIPEILLFPLSELSLFKKAKAIGHCILMR